MLQVVHRLQNECYLINLKIVQYILAGPPEPVQPMAFEKFIEIVTDCDFNCSNTHGHYSRSREHRQTCSTNNCHSYNHDNCDSYNQLLIINRL